MRFQFLKFKNWFKKIISSVVIFVLVFQMMPSRQPVQAETLMDRANSWIAKLTQKVSLPDISLTEKGELKAGSWTVTTPSSNGPHKIDCLGCAKYNLDKSKCLECVNPFSQIKLKWGDKELKSQKQLVYPADSQKKGEILVPEPFIPKTCELSIPLPSNNGCDEGDKECEKKILAKNKACIYLGRLQDSAAQEVYLANKIFNSTDPYSDCLFLKNCRTNCSLRLGELTLKASLLDVAALFVPGGFLTVVQKILDIAKLINDVWNIVVSLKTILEEGIGFINNIFDVMSQLSSLFDSFANLGLKWSDVLIYGGGALASNYLGNKVGDWKIGPDEKGNIGWVSQIKNAGTGALEWTLKAGDGVVGGAAATAVLNADRASRASDSLQSMLGSFAQNNLMFTTAKNEALQLTDKMKGEVETARQTFKAEPEISFLFDDNPTNSKKTALNKMLSDFQITFRSVDEFMNDISATARLSDGSSVFDLQPGGQQNADTKTLCNTLGDSCPETMKDYYCTTTLTTDENGNIIRRKFNLDFSGEVSGNGGVFCYLPNRITPATDGCDWLDLFKKTNMASQTWKDVFYLINPDYIAEKIVGCEQPCLDDNCQKSEELAKKAKCQEGLTCYETRGSCVINTDNRAWRLFWEQELGQKVGTFENFLAARQYLQHRPGGIGLDNGRFIEITTALDDLLGGGAGKCANLCDNVGVKPVYKNLFDYMFASGASRMDIFNTHRYFQRKMMALFPSLGSINIGSTVGFGNLDVSINDNGWSVTRQKIIDAQNFLKAGIQKDIMFFSLGLNELETSLTDLNNCVGDLGQPPFAGNLRTAPYPLTGVQYWKNPYFDSNTDTPPEFETSNQQRSWGTYWKISYDAGVAYENWDDKFKILKSYIGENNDFQKIEDVKSALSLGVSPEEPVVVYKIAQAEEYLENIKKTTLENSSDWNAIANQIIDGIIYGTPNKDKPVCYNITCSAQGQAQKPALFEQCCLGGLEQEMNDNKANYDKYMNCAQGEIVNATDNICANYDYTSYLSATNQSGLYFRKMACGPGLDIPQEQVGNEVSLEDYEHYNGYCNGSECACCNNDGTCLATMGETHETCPGDCVCDNDGVCDSADGETRDKCPNENCLLPPCIDGCAQNYQQKCNDNNSYQYCQQNPLNSGCADWGVLKTRQCAVGLSCANGKCCGNNGADCDTDNSCCPGFQCNGGKCASTQANCQNLSTSCDKNEDCCSQYCYAYGNNNYKNCQAASPNTEICALTFYNSLARVCGCYTGESSGACILRLAGSGQIDSKCPGNCCVGNGSNCGGNAVNCCSKFCATNGLCDVAVVQPYCGDGICNNNETRASCPNDNCPCVLNNNFCNNDSNCCSGSACSNNLCKTATAPTPVCGNGKCEFGENETCSNDCLGTQTCKTVSDGLSSWVCPCFSYETDIACITRWTQQTYGSVTCTTNLALCQALLNPAPPPVAPPPTCDNDGRCESGENTSNCSYDCRPSGPLCGNGRCETGETKSSCPYDCASSQKIQCLDCRDLSPNGSPRFCYPDCWNGNCFDSRSACESQGGIVPPFALNFFDKVKTGFQKIIEPIAKTAKQFLTIENVLATAGCGGDKCNNSTKGFCVISQIYKKLNECYVNHKAEFEPGFNAYIEAKSQKEFLETQRGSLIEAIKAVANSLQKGANELSKSFQDLQDKWKQVLVDFPPENEESATVKAQIEKILALQAVAERIVNENGPNVEKQIAAAQANLLSINEIIKKAKDPAKAQLQGIVDNFSSADGTGAIPILQNAVDFAYEKIGPKNIGLNYGCNVSSNQFLYRLKCFERDNGRTFKQLLAWTDVLRNIENVSFGLDQVSGNIKSIEPSIDMKPVEVKPNLVDEVANKICCCKGDTAKAICEGLKGDNHYCENGGWTNDNKDNRDKCNEKTTLYAGQRMGDSNYETFKNNILANPLSAIEDKFTALRTALSETVNSQGSAEGYISEALNQAFGKLGGNSGLITSAAVFGNNSNRVLQYRKIAAPILKEKDNLWHDLIWGNETSEKIKSACGAVGQILNSDPADILSQCVNRTKSELNINLLPQNNPDYGNLKNNCQLLSEIDLDVLDNLQENPDYLRDRINDLNKIRSCVAKESCANGSIVGVEYPCLVCPEHFCVNPNSNTWGAGMDKVDPYCIDHCGINDKQGDGLVCAANGIVWNTNTHGPLPSKNPTTAICNGLGFSSIASCTITNVNQRCDSLNNLNCSIFNNCSQTEINKQAEIKAARDIITANNCPKWFCLNGLGNWQGSAGLNSDKYCIDHCGVNDKQGDGMVCDTDNGIIWDTSIHPTVGVQKWKGTANSRTACIDAQNKLQALGALDATPSVNDCSPVGPVVSFCPDKSTCETMKNSCAAWDAQEAAALLVVSKPAMEWPPTTQCLNSKKERKTGLADKYEGAQAMCVGSQIETVNLNKFQEILNAIRAKNGLSDVNQAVAFLTDQCNTLEYQESFQNDCYNFDVIRKVFGNSTIGSVNNDDVDRVKKSVNQFCKITQGEGKIITKEFKGSGSSYPEFKCSLGNVAVDLTENTDDATGAREVAIKLCSQSATDMRTPLNEVMKVFSILLGVKSYTAASNGLGSLWVDAQKMHKRADDAAKLIEQTIENFKKLFSGSDSEIKVNKITKDNFDVKPVLCIKNPMVSYAGGSSKPLTGPEGGPVCPNVSQQFNQLDSMFSLIRQNLRMVDLSRRQPNTTFGFFEGDDGQDRLKITLSNTYEVDENLNELVQPIYDRAKNIKETSQLLWALSTAINYANDHCACGQSYCPMIGKVPLCVSGLPMTVHPLGDPFCHLVWTLRYPLGSLAEKLKQQLENDLQ